MSTFTSRRLAFGAALSTVVLALAACGGSGFSSAPATDASAGGLTSDASKGLTVLIGSSGSAETKAVKDQVAQWSSSSGTSAKVLAASDLSQQLSQGFAARKPPDVFYLSTDALAGYASNGSLLAYGDQLTNKADFYPALVTSFTYQNKFYCAPKDFSTLQLIVNTDLWSKAGLTQADYPKTWGDLETISRKLTTKDHAGLAVGGEYARVGAWMAQAGGNLMNADSTQATANSPENVAALTEVKKMLNNGTLKYAKDLGAGWGGEAFGKGLAAMTIEGNWIVGSQQSDYPKLKYTVVPLPAGPKGQGTLQFSNCWGIAADSPDQADALKLVQQLTSTQDQVAFSKAFGVMPSIRSAADQWKTDNPKLVPFIDAAGYAEGPPTVKGGADVVSDLNAKLATLAKSDPQKILDATQKNLQALTK